MLRPVLTSLVALALIAPAGASAEPFPADAKRDCVYPQHRISRLAEFEQVVGGRPVDCVLAYNDAAPTWEGWERPWFTVHSDPDFNWQRWKSAVPGRSLIVTQNLFPSSLNGTDWLARGAAGEFADHAAALARHLVSKGLADSVIRLAHEANGDWYPYSIGTTASDQARWAQFWRRTVLAMRSVPGAEFRFDWSINANYRNIPLANWYPGDDVVDFVGIDAYDSGVRDGLPRWHTIYNRPLGIKAVADFARAHGKPLSIPEWGVSPAGDPKTFAGGDNAEYVRGIAQVMHSERTAYQSYFFAHEWATQLSDGPLSLAAYRESFLAAASDAPLPVPTTPVALSRAAPRAVKPVAPAAPRRLRLVLSRKRVQAGRRVRVRVQVSSAGRPVGRAVVTLGSARARTGPSGRTALRVRISRPGLRYVRATLPGFSGRATAQLRVTACASRRRHRRCARPGPDSLPRGSGRARRR